MDHGERGREVVRQSGLLSDLDHHERACILDAIHYHNLKSMPNHLNGKTRPWIELIRDADKLDIFHTVYDAVMRDGFQDLPRMLPQVRLDGPVSPKLIDELHTRRSCSIGLVKSLGDFLLLQLSWVYDINYAVTFRQLDQRGMICRIAGQLPRDNETVNDLVAEAEQYVANHI